jgi:hypothetical protein
MKNQVILEMLKNEILRNLELKDNFFDILQMTINEVGIQEQIDDMNDFYEFYCTEIERLTKVVIEKIKN